jgi:hypothetical protein
MTKKVTGKVIRELIEQVMNEKYIAKKGLGIKNDINLGSLSKARSALAWGVKPSSQDNWEDIAALSDDDDINNIEPVTSKDIEAAILKGEDSEEWSKLGNKAIRRYKIDKYDQEEAEKASAAKSAQETAAANMPKPSVFSGKSGKLEAKIIAYTSDKKTNQWNENAPVYLIFFKGQVVPTAVLKKVSDDEIGPDFLSIYRGGLNLNVKDSPHRIPNSFLGTHGTQIKNTAPIVILRSDASSQDTAVENFLKKVDEIYSRGRIEPDTTSGPLNNLKDLLDKDPVAQRIFIDKIQNIVDMGKLKALTEDENKLEVSDFETLFNNFESLFTSVLKDAETSEKAAQQLNAIRQSLVDTYKASTNDDLKKAIALTLRSSKATGSVRATGGTTSGYRIGSTSASGGSVDFQVMEAFGNAFPNAGSLTERVNQFNTYVHEVNELINNKKQISGGVDKKFSQFIVLDLLQQILYDFEASSAGWVFESFLAFMAFGEAIGAGYGAGDFTIKNDNGEEIQGSAKLLQKGKTGQNFQDVEKDETIRYVIGIKETQITGDTTAPTKQGQRTGLLKIYIMDLTRTSGVAGETTGEVLVKQGGKEEKIVISDGRIDIEVLDEASPNAKLDLLFLQANEFQDISGRIVNDISEELKKSMEKMSSLKANIDDYVLNATKEDERMIYSRGALEDYNSLKNILFPSDGGNKLFGGNLESSAVSEQKITASFLKKLISESFKK